jgi:hypothetical protein
MRIIYSILFFIIIISKVLTIRVENLHEITKDSTSITIEWQTSISSSISLSSSSSSSLNQQNDWIGYKIKYSRDDDNAITLNYLNNLNENKYRIEKLLPFTNYKIQVSAYKSINNEEGPSSNLIYVRTSESGILIPSLFYTMMMTIRCCMFCFFSSLLVLFYLNHFPSNYFSF